MDRMNHRDMELHNGKQPNPGLARRDGGGQVGVTRAATGEARVVAGVPLAVGPGGIAADRAAEPPAANSSMRLMRSFATFSS